MQAADEDGETLNALRLERKCELYSPPPEVGTHQAPTDRDQAPTDQD